MGLPSGSLRRSAPSEKNIWKQEVVKCCPFVCVIRGDWLGMPLRRSLGVSQKRVACLLKKARCLWKDVWGLLIPNFLAAPEIGPNLVLGQQIWSKIWHFGPNSNLLSKFGFGPKFDIFVRRRIFGPYSDIWSKSGCAQSKRSKLETFGSNPGIWSKFGCAQSTRSKLETFGSYPGIWSKFGCAQSKRSKL